MKILIVIGHNLFSGVNTMVKALAKELILFGNVVDVQIHPHSKYSSYVEGYTNYMEDLRVSHLYEPLDIIGYENYDAIILNANYQFDWISKVDVPKIFVCHGLEEKETIPNNPFDCVVAVSDRIYEDIKADEIIYNGIDLKEYYPLKNINYEAQSAGYVYRGELPNKLREAADVLGIRLHHIRQYPDVPDFMNQVDFIIGYGRVIYEAMACGRPAFVYGEHGCDGWINDHNFLELRRGNCSGYYTECQYDVDGLVDQLKKYDFRQGKRNRILAEKHLSSTVMAKRYEELIRRVIDDKRQNSSKV